MSYQKFLSLLPDTPETTQWVETDLQEEYLKHPELNMKLIDDQNKLLNRLSKDCIRTYGGFGENRTRLWDGFETHGDDMIHLGVDFNNLTVGEQVASLTKGTVVDIWKDDSKLNGWGGRVVIKTDQTYFLYGHLDPQSLLELHVSVEKGGIVGKVGSEEVNGGWFPHVHLQIMTESFVQKRHYDWRKIDGYEKVLPEGIIDPVKFIM